MTRKGVDMNKDGFQLCCNSLRLAKCSCVIWSAYGCRSHFLELSLQLSGWNSFVLDDFTVHIFSSFGQSVLGFSVWAYKGSISVRCLQSCKNIQGSSNCDTAPRSAVISTPVPMAEYIAPASAVFWAPAPWTDTSCQRQRLKTSTSRGCQLWSQCQRQWMSTPRGRQLFRSGRRTTVIPAETGDDIISGMSSEQMSSRTTMSKTFNTLGNDIVDVFFNHLGFQAYCNCQERSNSPFKDYADRDLGSPDSELCQDFGQWRNGVFSIRVS